MWFRASESQLATLGDGEPISAYDEPTNKN